MRVNDACPSTHTLPTILGMSEWRASVWCWSVEGRARTIQSEAHFRYRICSGTAPNSQCECGARHYHYNSDGGGSPGRQHRAPPPAVRHITCLIDWTNVGYSAARSQIEMLRSSFRPSCISSSSHRIKTRHQQLTGTPLIGFSPGVCGHDQELRKGECRTKEAQTENQL